MKALHRIIIEPHITENTTRNMIDPRSGAYQYAFKVGMDANKQEIKEAIESRFGVEVDSVRTIIVRGKIKRVRMIPGKRPNWKKAYVKLVPGHKITEFEGI